MSIDKDKLRGAFLLFAEDIERWSDCSQISADIFRGIYRTCVK